MKRWAYYNEYDPFAAAWIRELIKAGHITDGEVDERSIEDVAPADLKGFTRCHFFAGIAVWDHALNNAGWGDSPVWTGSCPCQPFSCAGNGLAFDDERHLWPHFHHLIEVCRPPVVFGEQVASKAVDDWIDLVQSDLEGVGYAFGSVPFPSAGIGAPHIRDRNFWVAQSASDGRAGRRQGGAIEEGRRCVSPADERGELSAGFERSGVELLGGLGDTGRQRDELGRGAGDMGRAPSDQQSETQERQRCGNAVADNGADGCDGGLADSDGVVSKLGCSNDRQSGTKERKSIGGCGFLSEQPAAGPTNGFWRDADWLFCRDGKWRPVKSGSFPLVAGSPKGVVRGSNTGLPFDADKTGEARVMRLRGYGNAINAEAAKAFIECVMGY